MPFAEFLAPSEEVASCSRGINAQVFELGGGEREESSPGWDFASVFAEVATDEGEEGLGVWDEWCGRGDWAGLNVLMETSCFGRCLRKGQEEGGDCSQLMGFDQHVGVLNWLEILSVGCGMQVDWGILPPTTMATKCCR
jgi:hypothetical protein